MLDVQIYSETQFHPVLLWNVQISYLQYNYKVQITIL